jgi:hypothetical protein
MPGTTPRQSARVAFKAVLEAANLGVDVLERMPYEGAPSRSVVLTMVSGVTRKPAIGLRTSEATRALEEHHRIQIDCYHEDQAECERLAERVEQVILDHAETFEATYDILDVSKAADIDTTPPDSTVRQTRIQMDFLFYTHRAVS